MSVLWFYIMFNKLYQILSTKIPAFIYNFVFPKKILVAPTFNIFSCRKKPLNMLLSLALLMDGINLILTFEVLALKVLQERPMNGWVSGQLQPRKIAFHLGLGIVFRLALKLGWEKQFS